MSVGAVGYSTYAKRDASTCASENKWPVNWFWSLLVIVSELLENTVLNNHPWMREPLWKSWFPEKFQQTIRPKNMISEALEEVITLPTPPPHPPTLTPVSRWHDSGPRKVFSAHGFLTRGMECLCMGPQLPHLCGMLPQSPIFLQSHPES